MTIQEAVGQIADRYRAEGYNVVVGPSREQRPEFVASDEVDMLAYKGAEKVIVEVKVNREDLHDDQHVGRIAELVNRQPGWRFDLVVLNPESDADSPAHDASEPSEDHIQRDLDYAQRTADAGDLGFSCLIAWASLEAAMRRAARSSGLEVRNYSPLYLLQTLYSNGLLERDEYDRLSIALPVRNAALHGMQMPAIDPVVPQDIVSTARKLLMLNGHGN